MNTRNDTHITESELRGLLDREEGQFLEFKSLWDLTGGTRRVLDRRKARDWVAEYAAAFANADGGILLLGVEDHGAPSGHGYPPEVVDDVLAATERRLRPAVRCRAQRQVLDGHEILILQVPIAPEAVMVEANGFPYRAGDRVLREPQEVINARKEAYRRVGFEQRIRAEATLEDLDLDLVTAFLRNTVYGARSAEDLLLRYGLIHPRPGMPAVTNAALLLFGKLPGIRWHPRAGIRLFRVAGTSREHGAERNVSQLGRVDPPLASALVEAHRVVREHVRRSERLHDLFFREMPEYPEFAWQEAIINAVAHRDYEHQGREIEVWFYEDRMEIKSPGDLVPPVTLDAIRSRTPAHASRNPLIVRVFAEAGLMREEGEGIPRIFDEMQGSFLHEPEFQVAASEFVVTLRNEPIFSGPSDEWQRIVQGLALSVAQKRILLAHPEGFSNADYQRLNHSDRDQAYREIQEMVGLGVLTAADAPGRGAVYHVSPDLREARAFLRQRVPRLRELLRGRAHLKNADYRDLFAVTRDVARRELRQLVEDGYLKMEGERRGARYLAGPALRLVAE